MNTTRLIGKSRSSSPKTEKSVLGIDTKSAFKFVASWLQTAWRATESGQIKTRNNNGELALS